MKETFVKLPNPTTKKYTVRSLLCSLASLQTSLVCWSSGQRVSVRLHPDEIRVGEVMDDPSETYTVETIRTAIQQVFRYVPAGSLEQIVREFRFTQGRFHVSSTEEVRQPPVQPSKERSIHQLLLLIDGSSLLARSYYATAKGYHQDPKKHPLMNCDGVYTNAVHGMALNILELMQRFRPSHMVIAWDRQRQCFRNKIYPLYKAHREPKPVELDSQKPIAQDLFRKMGLFQMDHPEFEADDLIGSWVEKAEESGMPVLIVTGDKDALQLVSPTTSVWLYHKVDGARKYTPQLVCEKYSIQSVRQLIDWKALVGEKTDNIPGVRGIGEVKAKRLLAAYRDLDEMYQSLDRILEEEGKKVHSALVEERDMAYISKQLATIVRSIPEVLAHSLEAARIRFSIEGAREGCKELGLVEVWRNIRNRIESRMEAS